MLVLLVSALLAVCATAQADGAKADGASLNSTVASCRCGAADATRHSICRAPFRCSRGSSCPPLCAGAKDELALCSGIDKGLFAAFQQPDCAAWISSPSGGLCPAACNTAFKSVPQDCLAAMFRQQSLREGNFMAEKTAAGLM